MKPWKTLVGALFTALAFVAGPAAAQQKPNIILILSDDFGYGDSGPYGGGAGRGMPTPSLDRLADEGMTFFSFYGQPSCTPGPRSGADRPHPQPQRHDHRGLPGPGRRVAGGGVDGGVGAEDRRATRPSSRASGTWARPTMRCPPPKATTR